MTPSRGRALALALALLGLLAARPGQCKKTYVIKGMGTHYTTKGRQIRHLKPHKRLPLVQLKDGPGFVVGNPERAWGTRLAVYQLNRVMALYRAQFPHAPPAIILDLSKRGGGVLDNHNSHVDGRDVDIPLILNQVDDVTDTRPRTVNVERTWFVIKAIAETCDVEYMFLDRKVQESLYNYALLHGVSQAELSYVLQFPAAETARTGIVRHWTNHYDHVHVRFRHEGAPLLPAVKAYCDWRKRQD